MIEVRSTERKLATQQRAIEKPVQPAPRNTTDKGTSSVAFAAPGTEKATAKHIPSAARKPTEKRGTQAAEKAAAKPKKPQEQAAPAIEAEAPPLEHPEDAAATERPGTRGESEASVEAPAEGERKER